MGGDSALWKSYFSLILVLVPVSVYSYTSSTITPLPSTTRIRTAHKWDHSSGVHRVKSVRLLAKSKPNAESSSEDSEDLEVDESRRRSLGILAMASVALPVAPAVAGYAKIDSDTGQLYSPKAEMLSGGSAAARGRSGGSSRQRRLKPGESLQTVYDARFIAYLSRFLLNFDPAANSWWVQNSGMQDTWEVGPEYDIGREEVKAKFAEFAESVEIGLADYFVGPYGSYSSLPAMKAGISASNPAKSARAYDPKVNVFGFLFMSWDEILLKPIEKEIRAKDRDTIAKQGVLNLYTLLKARYTSVAAKRQMAILFSFFPNSEVQPTAEIHSLLGEADNATVTRIDLIRPISASEPTSRTSSRRGGGYSASEVPTVTIDVPPALGADYKCAKASAVMKGTGRVLRIVVTDPGEGYESPPEVYVDGASRTCAASAMLDREGHVESILVLDPGYGYGKRKMEPPTVRIQSPKNGRKAKAVAELEYEVSSIELTEGGNGYVNTEPPEINISPPDQDPDWFIDAGELDELYSEVGPLRAEVAEMRDQNGNLAFALGKPRPPIVLPLKRIRDDPLDLLPSNLRPVRNSLGSYIIPAIAAFPTYDSSPNPRYRAVDPLFGAIGTVPVTKTALELKPSEYARLALSGAVCTVLVRTALNPLELIKTKLQLKNDKELLDFARERNKAKSEAKKLNESSDQSDKKAVNGDQEEKVGAFDLIFSLAQLRGIPALFQSADITFLASLVFGSFGFGATELFRRSLTAVVLSEGGNSKSELVLLLAATIATIITSAAAAPFELLRVRSMGVVESKKWTEVLEIFLNEKAGNSEKVKDPEESEFRLKDVNPKDLLPLWAGFPPTASRELAFAIPKFLAFDILANFITGVINSQAGPGSLPIQVGVGNVGLAISAISGAVAGIAGAIVSHPADLILTYTSATKKKTSEDDGGYSGADWRDVVKDLLSKEGGISNLFVGLPPRLVFFFLVIGLQFFLYDYVKNLLNVGSDDLSLVLDVFYAVRQGLTDMT